MTLSYIVLYQLDGTDRTSAVELQKDGSYPPVISDGQHEWVLARRPGVSENVFALRDDGSNEPASTLAEYHESKGVDATCLTCEIRVRYRTTIAADDALGPCRTMQHTTMLLYLHLDDANVIEWLQRTVGDVREATSLLGHGDQ